MNKRQKEIQQVFLDSEKAVLKKIEENYQDALFEINDRIERLLARKDADMQNVIYQVEYQKALKAQVEVILEQLHANEFETVSEYLAKAYEDGFVGTMYDLQGQGIPLVIPIDQEQVVAAIQHETKLSEGLYNALGKDTKKLSKQIAQEISRGISNAATYGEMARNIANFSNIPKNNAARIARTEAHRIQNKATADAQWKAKEKGAEVLKQWDSTLDGKTRSTHRELDGQIRELDEPFEVAGKKAMQPGDFGDPAEDCNCRCALLQRARWALGNDFTKWDKESDGIVELKAKDYDSFKMKYAKESERVRSSVQKINESINEQIELLKKYGNETNILFNGSHEELTKWGELKKITNKSGTELLYEMSKSADNWEAILNMQSENILELFVDQLIDVATDEELSALNLWSGETYANINRYMRFGINVDDISKNAAKKIESVLDKITTNEEIIVHRGTGTKHIFEKIKGDWKSDPTVLIGQSFPDAGFVATSPLKEGGFSGVGESQAELFIKVPKGTHGAYIAKQAHNENEKEFLLQRGYSYRIIKAEYRENPIFTDEKDLKVWCEVILDD